ncbi:MAG: T9SS type A sorting domain-containing protein [Bacteroidales bacterium]|nr:T9SS type A sorting domain-containing protein [Bacteroidales bacterium]
MNTVTFEHNTEIGNIGNWFQFAFTTPTIHNITAGNWSDPTIWNTVPNTTSSVTIAADCTVDEDVVVANLTISDGVTLTVETGVTLIVTENLVCDDVDGLVIKDRAQVINESAGVMATFNKRVEAWTSNSNGWHLISSPVNEMEIAGSDFVIETFDLFRYNETTPAWENYRNHPEFTIFENGRGFLYANDQPDFEPGFMGELNYDDVEYAVTNSEYKVISGVNVIGNPFPHNIYKGVGGAINDSYLASGYYGLTYNGEWEVHTYDDPIGPGQGILVIASTNTNITIAKTNAVATDETDAKGDVKRLKIKVSGNGHEDRVYAYFNEGNGLYKIDNYSSNAAQISIQKDANKYAIAHVGGDCDELDVMFKNTKNAEYTITMEDTQDFSYLYLIDNVTGDVVNMLVDDSYTFHANGHEVEERFKVVMREYSSIGENNSQTMFAYMTDSHIVIKGEGLLQLVDITGRVVKTKEIRDNETLDKPSCGVYVLRMINGNDVKTQKIVVR